MILDFQTINKIIRENNKVFFHKRDYLLDINNKNILIINEIVEIEHPNILQKYRYIVVSGPNLVETDSINDIMYTDYSGHRAFSKSTQLLSYF